MDLAELFIHEASNVSHFCESLLKLGGLLCHPMLSRWIEHHFFLAVLEHDIELEALSISYPSLQDGIPGHLH